MDDPFAGDGISGPLGRGLFKQNSPKSEIFRASIAHGRGGAMHFALMRIFWDALVGATMSATIGNRIGDSRRACARNDFRAPATRSFFPLLSLVLAGCAIHPVQKDVTGFRTADIVDRIRCESRLAIQDKAIAMLRGYGERTHNPQPIAIAADLEQRRGSVWKFDPRILDRDERIFFNKYIETAIAYEFTFDITEANKLDPALSPVGLITGGTVGINLLGGNDLTRQSTRRFALSENFEEVLSNDKLRCLESYLPPNFQYPMSGRIGMQELIDTFIDLNQDKDLATLDSSPRVFADTLMFTTAISGSLQPHIEIAAVGTRWGLASPTNISASVSRSDVHKLIVGLSMGALSKTAAAHLIPGAALAPAVRPSAVATSKNANQSTARDAIMQQHVYDFYDHFGTFLAR
jgi:hypothetical protein